MTPPLESLTRIKYIICKIFYKWQFQHWSAFLFKHIWWPVIKNGVKFYAFVRTLCILIAHTHTSTKNNDANLEFQLGVDLWLPTFCLSGSQLAAQSVALMDYV